MKLIVKKLQGGECSVEVSPMSCITDIKHQVYKKLGISISQQKLLLLGRTLADDQTIQSYPSIKDGTRLNLVVKKPEGLLETSMKYFKSLGMSDNEAKNTANKLLKVTQEKFNKMSWDDIEKLSMSCLMDECGVKPVDKDLEAEENMHSL